LEHYRGSRRTRGKRAGRKTFAEAVLISQAQLEEAQKAINSLKNLMGYAGSITEKISIVNSRTMGPSLPSSHSISERPASSCWSRQSLMEVLPTV